MIYLYQEANLNQVQCYNIVYYKQEGDSYKTSVLKNLTCHMAFWGFKNIHVGVFYYGKSSFVVIIQRVIFSNRLRYFYDKKTV